MVEEIVRGMGIKMMFFFFIFFVDNFIVCFLGFVLSSVLIIVWIVVCFKGKMVWKYLINCFGNNYRFI